MPRSKPQDTRRRLISCIEHFSYIVMLLDEVIPEGVPVEELDVRYQYLNVLRAVAAEAAAAIENILEGKGEGQEVAPNS